MSAECAARGEVRRRLEDLRHFPSSRAPLWKLTDLWSDPCNTRPGWSGVQEGALKAPMYQLLTTDLKMVVAHVWRGA